MNERVKELAEQALNEYSATYHNEAKIPEAYLKKFAELIVQECVNVSQKNSHRYDDMGAIIARNIEDHFGVEE